MGAGGAPVFGVPESTPASRPFSATIKLNTSPTERTPWPGFHSYLPDITRASPTNLSESDPASVAKAAWMATDCAWTNGAIGATASAQSPSGITIFFIGSPCRYVWSRSDSCCSRLTRSLFHPWSGRRQNGTCPTAIDAVDRNPDGQSSTDGRWRNWSAQPTHG